MKKERELVKEVAHAIQKAGGSTYYVGGYVRDQLIGLESKDIDLEIYGITAEQLYTILSQFGSVIKTGASFGVYMIKGCDIDFALPRTERKTGEGHKGFVAKIDPFISTKEGSRRRDITINSLMRDVLSGEVIDHWGGMTDLQMGVINVVDPKTFIEDSLRVLRVCQIASRLSFTMSPQTKALCQQIALDDLPCERIAEEFKKGLLKSSKPSLFLENLRVLGILDKYYPELAQLALTPQSPQHHPEGDVWQHTLMVVDEAKKLSKDTSNPFGFMLAALVHDIGKPAVITQVDGRYQFIQHDVAGVEIAKTFLRKISREKELTDYVANLVRLHMRPFTLYPRATAKALRKLALVSICLDDVLLIAEADHKGRGGVVEDFTAYREWFDTMKQALQLDKPIQPLIKGADLMAHFGIKPSPKFKTYLQHAFELQLDGLDYGQILIELEPVIKGSD